MTSTGDRNFSRCTVCGQLFENHNETLTTCSAHRLRPRPGASTFDRRTGGAHKTRKRELDRKRKHKGKSDD